MECTHCREIVSAHLDGEDQPGEWAHAQRHLDACPVCRAFEVDATELHRAARLMPAEPVPDLTAAILAATADAAPGPRDPLRALRPMLVVVAAVQIAFAVPGLLFGEASGLPVHSARHLGSFSVALAVGFLLVALRPDRSLAGLLPVTAALVACLVGTALVDVVAGRAAVGDEFHHVTEVVGLAIMWLLRPESAYPRLAA